MTMQQAAWRMVTVLGVALFSLPVYADQYSDANQLATERENAGQLDAAAAVLENLAPQYPQDLALALRMAWLRFRANSYSRALSHYQGALRLSPESIDGRLGMGWTLQRLKRCEEARPYFVALATVHPNLSGAKDGLAACPVPPRVRVSTGALLTGMAYTSHYLRLGGLAVSPRMELVLDGKWLIGAAYRYSDFFLKPTTTVTQTPPTPPMPPFPPRPPMQTVTTTNNDFSQHEAYVQLGYQSSRFGLLGRYAYLVDSRGTSSASHHVGLGLRVSTLGDAQLQLATSLYSDMTIVRAAPTWRLPIGKGFAVQIGGVAQLVSSRLLGSGNLEFSFVRDSVSAWAGGSYGEQLRPAQLEILVITNMSERIAASAWGGIGFRLPHEFSLLFEYRYDRLRKLPDVTQSTESNASYITLGLSKAF